MTTYTLFGQPTVTAGADGGVGTRTYGLWFQLSQSATLTGIWFYSVGGASVLPTECEIWQSPSNALVASTQNLSPSWSGAAGSGWVKCTYNGSVTLSSGVWYCASVGQSSGSAVNWAAIQLNYWSSGPGASGLTNGIITAPNAAGSPTSNQNAAASGGGAPGQFPSGGVVNSNFWVDVEVATGTAHTATASLTVTPSFSAARTRGHSRTGSLTVTPSFSAARTRGHSRTGSATVTPSFSAARLLNHGRTGSATVTPSFSAARLRAAHRTGSLTATPSFSAARTHGHSRTAALTATPSFTTARVHGHGRTAALTATPVLAAVRTAAHVRHPALTVTPVLSATGHHAGTANPVLFGFGDPRWAWTFGAARNE